MANAKRAVEQDEIGKPYRSEADVSILLDRVESGQLPEHVAEHAALGVFGGADRIVDSAETVFHPRFCRFRMASKGASPTALAEWTTSTSCSSSASSSKIGRAPRRGHVGHTV